MKLAIIVAIDENNWIWRNNQLLCHLADDLKNFKSTTLWHPVIMWKKTFFTFPNWALPNRTNIVLSLEKTKIENCIVCNSIDEVMDLEEVKNSEISFVIWWWSIYSQFFDLVDELHITRIQHAFEWVDTFFPKIDEKKWNLISKSEIHPADERNKFPFYYEIYQRK